MSTTTQARLTLADWRHFLRRQGLRGSGLASIIIGVVVAAALVTAMALLIRFALPDASGLVLLIGIPLAGLWLIANVWIWLVSASRGVRMQRWATARGLGYRDRAIGTGRTPWRGMPFPIGGRFVLRRYLSGADGLETGRYRAIPEPGSNTASAFTKPFSFVSFELPVSVPHIVVTNKRSSVLAWAGIGIAKGRKLGGSTEFDGVFTLHCPVDYERDALYIFTPDLLAALLDYAPGCELELVDDIAFLYFAKEPALWREETAEALLVLTAKLRGKLERQTQRYRDERAGEAFSASAPSPNVALGGLRLGQGISGRGRLVLAFSWIPFALAIGYFAWQQLS